MKKTKSAHHENNQGVGILSEIRQPEKIKQIKKTKINFKVMSIPVGMNKYNEIRNRFKNTASVYAAFS